MLLLVVEPSGRRIKLMWIIFRGRGLTTLCLRKGKTTAAASTLQCYLQVPSFFSWSLLLSTSQLCYTRKQTPTSRENILYSSTSGLHLARGIFLPCRHVHDEVLPAFGIFESSVEFQVVMAMRA